MIRLLYESPYSVFEKRFNQYYFILEVSPRYQEFAFTDKSNDSMLAQKQLQLTLALPWTYYAGWSWRGDNVNSAIIKRFGCRRNEINSTSTLEKIFALPLPHYNRGHARPLDGCFGTISIPLSIDIMDFYPYIVNNFYASRWNYFMQLDPVFHLYLFNQPCDPSNWTAMFRGRHPKLRFYTAMDVIDKYQDWSNNYDLDNICDAPFVGVGEGATLADLIHRSGEMRKSGKTFPDYISTPPLNSVKKLKISTKEALANN